VAQFFLTAAAAPAWLLLVTHWPVAQIFHTAAVALDAAA